MVLTESCPHMKFCSKARVSPKCAFDADGSFVPDNWMCFIMNRLRYMCVQDAHNDDESLAEGVFSWRDDESAGSIGVIHFGGGYLVMTWYKNRGCTSDALIASDGERSELTLETASQIVAQGRAEEGGESDNCTDVRGVNYVD